MRHLIIPLILASTFAGAAQAAVFQYSVPVATAKEPSTAFLWIPPAAKEVRGVVMAGMTLMEREFVKDPQIRAACADQDLAIVFLKCGLGAVDLQKVLDDLAAASGYKELATVPLMFVGHSAGGPQAKAAAIKFGSRCFGLMQYRGGVPWGEEAVPDTIRCLVMVGQFDEFGGVRDASGHEPWEKIRAELTALQAKDPSNNVTMVVEPGAGHFGWSERNGKYMAAWIRHQKTDDAGYEAGLTGKKDQFTKWNDPYWIDAGVRYFFNDMKWVGDGQTFEVHPVYADVYPPRWPDAGKPVGHSNAPIRVRTVSGPLVATGPNTFRLELDALNTEVGRATFLAYSPGDAEYRYTEQVGMMPRGWNGFHNGKAQSITFAPIDKSLELKATSDADLPVEYYVASGPAIVEGGKLKLAEVPARAKFPVTVKVVAYQFGRGLDPKVQTAKPVEQTVAIEKP